MSPCRVLLFAYHFPPENVVGAARPFRFYKYLSRMGYECHVITAADVSKLPELSAERVADPFIESSARGAGWQVERAVRKLLLPGTIGTQWALHAFRAGKRNMESHPSPQRTVLFSTFPPLGAHLAAWRLVQATGTPWIADYRDPLAGNPATARLGRHTQMAYRKLDESFVRTAAAVIANTDSAQAAMRSRVPRHASKIHLIWNGFDPEQRLYPAPVEPGTVRVVSHLGELYEGRNAAPILESIARLIGNARVNADDLRVQLIGPAEDSCLPAPQFLAGARSCGWLKIVAEQRPKSEAQQIAQTSHGLLIVQPYSAVQVPGKLFEYLQIGRPILAYVPRESAIERLLAPSGVPFRFVYPDEAPEVFDHKIAEFLELDATPVQPSAWFEETFNAEAQTAALACIIESVLKR